MRPFAQSVDVEQGTETVPDLNYVIVLVLRRIGVVLSFQNVVQGRDYSLTHLVAHTDLPLIVCRDADMVQQIVL